MNFSVFNTATTNIFPLANDTKGGQLMTEYNLKSRESVSTLEAVKYNIGHSYVHSEDDFKVSLQSDGAGGIISNYTLEISSGRGVIDGHFIESLAPVLIDMLDANAAAQVQSTAPLKGKLTVGLRAMYSTEQTMAGSMLTYNNSSIYEGVQVVILPKSDFFLPEDVPEEPDRVTAHLKLADFSFTNGKITSVVNNYPNKVKNIPADRISNIDNLLSNVYVKKTGLNPRMLYTFAGKGTDPATGLDTWCDSTGALMVWDHNPQYVSEEPSLLEAEFGVDVSGKTVLQVPHKQIDGPMTNPSAPDTNIYFADKSYVLPLANYAQGTSGTVDKAYTNNVKAVSEKLNNIYRMPNGKQVGYISVLDNREDLPAINSNWNIGDYIVVGEDNTLNEQSDGVGAPSTMYILLPGIITEYIYKTSVSDSTVVPTSLTGIEIARDLRSTEAGDTVDTSNPEVYRTYFDLSPQYRGTVQEDYFLIILTTDTGFTCYYFTPSVTGTRGYSEPVHITGQIPMAQEDTIGGFYNVPETALDAGYIFRDETGHLRLLDYTLLRSGTLAYQLGEDFSVPAGLSAEEIQDYLDEYVNQRIAFPNFNQAQNAENSNIINITIPLSASDDISVINIYDIDSRFNTSIYLHITGNANDNTTINISDCQRVRIDSNIGGTPKINLYRSALYYDASIIDTLDDIHAMSLWYEKYEDSDADLLVDNMTVRAIGEPVIPNELDYWNTDVPNDNHYLYALQSITFSPDGTIVGCGLYVKNATTSNVSEGKSILSANFTLPQGAGLVYPKSKLTRAIKVTGSFISAYPTDAGYMVLDTNFTALTDTVNPYNPSQDIDGVIAFYTDVNLVSDIVGLPADTELQCWSSNEFQCFNGIAI